METTSNVLPADAMQDLMAINHFIPKDAAIEMNKKYEDFRIKLDKEKPKLPFVPPTLPLAITYNKQALIDLFAQDGCVAFRVYPGVNKAEQLALIFVGVDAEGNNILGATTSALSATTIEPDEDGAGSGGILVDEGQMSPPYPAPAL